MFYLYTNEVRIKNKTHRICSTIIEVLGRFLGIIWIQNSSKGNNVGRKKIFQVWSIVIKSLIIINSSFLTYMGIAYYDINNFNILIFIFRKCSVYSYYSMISMFLILVTFQKKIILKLFKHAYKLYLFKISTLQKTQLLNHLFHKFLIKTGFDMIMIFIFAMMSIKEYLNYQSTENLIFSFTLPLTLIVYCFIASFHYLTFAFAYFLMKNFHLSLTFVTFPQLSDSYLILMEFVKKVNKFLEVTIVLYVFHAFTAFVIQVTNF